MRQLLHNIILVDSSPLRECVCVIGNALDSYSQSKQVLEVSLTSSLQTMPVLTSICITAFDLIRIKLFAPKLRRNVLLLLIAL